MKRGFTLVEILIVIAILTLLTAVSVLAFRSMYAYVTLKSASQEVYTLIQDARSKTLASENGFTYGLYVASTSITQYRGTTYVPGDAHNEVYMYEGGVTATGTMVTTGATILFERLTGNAAGAGAIYLRNSDGTATKTIRVQSSGLVEFE